MTDQKQAGSRPANGSQTLTLDDPDWDRPTDTSPIPDFNEVRKTRPKDPFPVRAITKHECLVDTDTEIKDALIIMEGEAEEFTIGEDGTEMRNRLCLLQAGDIVCPEYFAGLRSGSKSPRTVAALTDGWAYRVRMEDLIDPDITRFLRRDRLNLVLHAFGRRSSADLNAVIGALSKERYVEEALDTADAQVRKAEAEAAAERAARAPLDQEIVDLNAALVKLKRENERLVEQAKQITKETVDNVLLAELKKERAKLRLMRDVEHLMDINPVSFLAQLQEMLTVLYSYPKQEIALDAVSLSQTVFKEASLLSKAQTPPIGVPDPSKPDPTEE